jgi:hypothetical protein
MDKITLFQKKCFDMLLTELENAQITIVSCGLIKGKEESYYKVEFDDFVLWIYEDMADVKGKGKTKLVKIFEPQDFDSEEELINSFIGFVKKLVSSQI